MFTVHCPRHGREVLLSDDQIERLDNVRGGIEVRWVCYCGERGVLTTSHRARPSSAVA